MTRTLLFVAALALIPRVVMAGGPIAVDSLAVDAGEGEVVVTMVGAAAPGAAPHATGDRIEVELEPGTEAMALPVQDALVSSVEIRGGSKPRLSIKLRAGRRATQRFAQTAQLASGPGGLMITIPRDAEAALAAMAARTATTTSVAAAGLVTPDTAYAATTAVNNDNNAAANGNANAAAANTDNAANTADDAIAAAQAPPGSAAAALAMPADELAPATGTTEAAPNQGKQPIATLADGGMRPTMMVALGGIALVAGAFVLLRRRKAAAPAPEAIQVIATRALGGKSKAMLLAAGGRQVLVAVDSRGVRLLARWRDDGGNDADETFPALGAGNDDPNLWRGALGSNRHPTVAAPATPPRRAAAALLADPNDDFTTRPATNVGEFTGVHANLGYGRGGKATAAGASSPARTAGNVRAVAKGNLPIPTAPRTVVTPTVTPAAAQAAAQGAATSGSPAVRGLLALRKRNQNEAPARDERGEPEWQKALMRAARENGL